MPAAGKRLPTTASGGSISVTVKNDSPDDITVMYTGPVTGSLPQGLRELHVLLPRQHAGARLHTVQRQREELSATDHPTARGHHVLHHKGRSGTGNPPASDTAELRSGYIYTECAYTASFGY